ncbi:hypothetical protein CLCR_10133 [Cladophialophora carrionii]|uniref:Xylanolytic transcriptional activator regulatory domain-containing protein n=1 Tax=Cladophialophora carrionii TaxID=86049 RepID=A0A1C1CX75_9EURO|nr:hypothetical protein CLCR_10133 [Cladophialophora carrionii]
MQAELAELRKLAKVAPDGGTSATTPAANIPSVASGQASLPAPAFAATPSSSSASAANTLQGLCITDKSIDDVHLTAAHVNELFRVYFTRCHPYLPFTMCQSIESIYDRCPMLFWVICAVASPDTARPRFEAPIRGLMLDVLDPSKESGVEMVQAILILCMWPFPFNSQKADLSFIYSGLATQISLSLGLHRPAVDAGFGNETTTTERQGDEEIRRTTWLACFVVAQIQASRRGVPATVSADYSLLSSLDDPAVPQELSHLCYISHLTVDATQALGARGSNTTGLVEPSSRISMINVFGKQFEDLRRQRFPQPTDIVDIFYLNSRLQLWSFALHNDVPVTANSVQIIYQAREDAIRLIQVACEKNLSLVPFYTRRSVCYAGLLLYRIKLGSYGCQDDMIEHHIDAARQALSTSEGPGGPSVGQFLATVTSPDNMDAFTRASGDKDSPHRSRMGAFLVFDFHRVYTDLRQANVFLSTEFLDFDNLPWMEFQ